MKLYKKYDSRNETFNRLWKIKLRKCLRKENCETNRWKKLKRVMIALGDQARSFRERKQRRRNYQRNNLRKLGHELPF